MTWLDDVTFATVIVHTINGGPSYKGLRRAVHDDGLVLGDVGILEPEGIELLQDNLFIPREQVHAIQLLGGDG